VTPLAETAGAPRETMKCHYIKGNQFRVMHIDGAIGGMTPQGLMSIVLYSERFPIPLQTVHEISEGKMLGTPQSGIARDGIVREAEADLIMTLEVAKGLVDWLSKAIEQTEAILARGKPQ
jgi:hypothetical protein